MQIYITKQKNKFKKRFETGEKYTYIINFYENDFLIQEHFENYHKLIDRLKFKKLYKTNYFPIDLIKINEFIDKGFSIYF